MNGIVMKAAACAAVWVLGGPALAQDEPPAPVISEDLEVTMVLLPQGADRPDTITHSIELPAAAAAGAGDAGSHGRETAEQALENRQDGLDTATEARARGRAFGQDMAERARENREEAGRGTAPVEPPAGPPEDLPNPPIPPQD